MREQLRYDDIFDFCFIPFSFIFFGLMISSHLLAHLSVGCSTSIVYEYVYVINVNNNNISAQE